MTSKTNIGLYQLIRAISILVLQCDIIIAMIVIIIVFTYTSYTCITDCVLMLRKDACAGDALLLVMKLLIIQRSD
jgi:hypothetical protein